MGLRGIIKYLFKNVLIAILVALVILLLPNLPPHAKISEPYTVAPSKLFEGNLALNNKLDGTEKWLEGEVFGPEAFAQFNGELYTSLYGGDIVKITGKHITPIIKFGKPCERAHEEKLCGRPLGLEFDKNGNLYAVDAYYGIFKVNVRTGEYLKLINLNEEIEGKKPKLPNSLTISSNGDIYWTDSTAEFELQDGVFDLLADGSGRLIHYDPRTKKNTVLINNLHFANGVVLSDDEQFVIVAETARSRLWKYNLAGPKKGTQEIFIDGLPGLPDNLNSDGKGGFLVPLILSTDGDHPAPSQILGPFPSVRKIAARFLAIIELGFKTLNKYYPCTFAAKGEHFVGHFSTTLPLKPSRSTVLQISKTGEILSSIHTNNRNIGAFSEAFIIKDVLYLGSPFINYIGRIPLSKLGWEHLEQKAIPKVQTTTQVPTTQKPVTQTPPPPPPTKPTTTQAPRTTQPPTTQKPTTQAPRTQATTTQAPTTARPVTKPPTQVPTTPKPVPHPTPAATTQSSPPVQQKKTPPSQQATPKPNVQQAPPKAANQGNANKPPTSGQVPPQPKATPQPDTTRQQQTPPPQPTIKSQATQQKPTPAAAKQQTPPPTQKPVAQPVKN